MRGGADGAVVQCHSGRAWGSFFGLPLVSLSLRAQAFGRRADRIGRVG